MKLPKNALLLLGALGLAYAMKQPKPTASAAADAMIPIDRQSTEATRERILTFNIGSVEATANRNNVSVMNAALSKKLQKEAADFLNQRIIPIKLSGNTPDPALWAQYQSMINEARILIGLPPDY